jgi:Thiolase, C-terminal domain
MSCRSIQLARAIRCGRTPGGIPVAGLRPTDRPQSRGILGCRSQRPRGNFSTGKPTLAWAHDTGADLAKTNVNGGAIAIGHPLGASGARIMTTMVNALEQRGGRYALQTMCEAGGMANATIIERL